MNDTIPVQRPAAPPHTIELAIALALGLARLLLPLVAALVALALTAGGKAAPPLAGIRQHRRLGICRPTPETACYDLQPLAGKPRAVKRESRQRLNGKAASGRQQLAALRVVELRQLARKAGHRQLARSGRKAELLEVLARPC